MTRRRVSMKDAGPHKKIGVGLKQRAEEKTGKAGLRLNPLFHTAGVCHFHGGELAREIFRNNPQHSLADNRTPGILAVIDCDVERGGCRPNLEHEVGVRNLESLEVIGSALVGHHLHAVAHVVRVDVTRIDRKKVEAAIGHCQRPGRKRWRRHGSYHARLMGGVGSHVVQIVAGNGQGEFQGRVVRLALVEAVLVAGIKLKRRRRHLELRGEVAFHCLGELNAGLQRYGGVHGRGRQPIVERPAAFLGHKRHRTLCEGGNGK